MNPKNPQRGDGANKDPQQKTADRGVHIVYCRRLWDCKGFEVGRVEKFAEGERIVD